MPTYQRRKVVGAAVEALRRIQYTGQLELIVVIDGSTDGTAEHLAAMTCPFPFKVIEQSNRGAAHARNRGAAEASHDILLFLDDDMICDPAMVAEHARSYIKGADAVIGEVLHDHASPAGFMSDAIREWLQRKDAPLTVFDVWTGQLSVRRSIFEEIGGFDATFTNGAAFANEDADFGVTLLARYDVRRNPAAISRQHYVVTPRELMDRAPRWVAGDLRLARKHAALTRDLFEARGASRPATRLVYRPLSRLPVVPRLLAAAAVPVATFGLKTPLRSNRALSRFFLGSRALAYWTALRRSGWYPFSDRLLILGYHAIRDLSDDPVLASYGVAPEQFAGQIDDLLRRGFVLITPDAFAAFLLHDAPLPRRAVLLTFDDCYPELLAVARDILQPRGIEGIAFAVTALNSNEWDGANGATPMRLLHPSELKELADLGIEIGSHTRTHPHLAAISEIERVEEIAGSAEDIAVVGLPQPRFFAYPFGEVDAASRRCIQYAGFVAALGIEERWADRGSDRFNLPRVIVRSSDRGWRFRLKTAAPKLHERLAIRRERLRKRWR